MMFEIRLNKQGNPFLKMVDRPRRYSEDGRGIWIEIGTVNTAGI